MGSQFYSILLLGIIVYGSPAPNPLDEINLNVNLDTKAKGGNAAQYRGIDYTNVPLSRNTPENSSINVLPNQNIDDGAVNVGDVIISGNNWNWNSGEYGNNDDPEGNNGHMKAALMANLIIGNGNWNPFYLNGIRKPNVKPFKYPCIDFGKGGHSCCNQLVGREVTECFNEHPWILESMRQLEKKEKTGFDYGDIPLTKDGRNIRGINVGDAVDINGSNNNGNILDGVYGNNEDTKDNNGHVLAAAIARSMVGNGNWNPYYSNGIKRPGVKPFKFPCIEWGIGGNSCCNALVGREITECGDEHPWVIQFMPTEETQEKEGSSDDNEDIEMTTKQL